MSTRHHLPLIAALTLTGCASGIKQEKPVSPIPAPKIQVSEILLEDCEPLPPLEDPTLQGMMTNHIETVHLYNTCQRRHHFLVRSIRTYMADEQVAETVLPLTSTVAPPPVPVPAK